MNKFRPLNILFFVTAIVFSFANSVSGQINWRSTDQEFAPLPSGFHVFSSTDSLDGQPFRAYYAIADISNAHLLFTTDTTHQRRLTPSRFFEKNKSPLLVVNSTFFSFGTNQNLNLVVKNGKMVGYNVHTLPGKGKDTLTYRHAFNGAIGISKKRVADVAWVFSDSSARYPRASQLPIPFYRDSLPYLSRKDIERLTAVLKQKKPGIKTNTTRRSGFQPWKMQSAVAGGPVLIQNGEIKISNNEELKFNGRALNDQHPRTLMGYTKDNKLVIMVVEGRNPGISHGVNLLQAARLMKEVGCVEALNLDGGGSSCLLINGKETIRPSDKGQQRPIPAVFMIDINR